MLALSREEVSLVLADLYKRRRYFNSRVNNIIFRLSCCCGLRRKEISGLDLADVTTEGAQPGIRIRWQITKGGIHKRKSRFVPLSLDQGTLADIAKWKEYRLTQVAAGPLVADRGGNRLSVRAISLRWRTAIRCLPEERIKQLSCHKGRHTFASVVLSAEVPVTVLRDWLGHESIATTNQYAHAMGANITNLFGGK